MKVQNDLQIVIVFSIYMHQLSKQERFVELCKANLKVGIGQSISEITNRDIKGFYRYTGYLNV